MGQTWTKRRCAEEAAKYTTSSEFVRGSRGAYRASLRNGWLDEIGAHLKRERTPSRLITKELCAEEALKYSSRVEFQKQGKKFYIAARRRGWLDAICSHMEYRRNPSNELTFERCAQEAQRYGTRTEFARNSTGYYIKARRMGWLDKICAHMEIIQQTWTKEMCAAEAAKFSTRSAFVYGSRKAYKAAHQNGWLDELCTHMHFLRKPGGYWTKERCAEVARGYSVRKEFEQQDKGCYIYALRRGWLDEICSHMERQGSRIDRYIYIIFSREQRRAYVGLTFNKEDRLRQHKLRGRAAVKSLLAGRHKIVWSRLMGREDTAILEDDLIRRLREKGFELVNARRGGTLGGDILVWTFEACCAEARKYSSRSAFQRGSGSAYESARKKGWLPTVCAHMTNPRSPNGTWNKDRCAREAEKYQSRSEFERGCSGAYNASRNAGWLDEICSHMHFLRKPGGYWTKERCMAVALRHQTRTKFSRRDAGAYQAAWKNGWLDEICAHMSPAPSN